MIPTLILVGLGLGLMPRQWERRVPAMVVLSLLMALTWGLLVGAPLGGALLALVNIALGIPLGFGIQRLLGLGIRKLGYAVVHRPSHGQRTQRR